MPHQTLATAETFRDRKIGGEKRIIFVNIGTVTDRDLCGQKLNTQYRQNRERRARL